MAIYLGSQAVTLYIGAVEVASPGGAFLDGLQVFPAGPTGPGAPTIISAVSQGPGGGEIELTAPENGGSTITGYNVYVVGTTDPVNEGVVADGGNIVSLDFEVGAEVQIAAVNAIGEGPKSDPELVT